ncbi:YybH family protein [Streptomyces muensis]|uniref:Nuclear transport factor 2 family protein n=1 Tax=Streptomyces muensis TaxID=1077944 RepID=A0A9X1Q0J3_STRM4|nr:nuclear transport factor 2 family protein [Streptomyces muensis]MCF1595865.1 nuclear transport factor 2 family protein [Streptomyces muensis]
MTIPAEQFMDEFVKVFASGDIDALMEYYEPESVIMAEPGVAVSGTEEIRAVHRKLLDLGGQLVIGEQAILESGPYALLTVPFHMERREPGGTAATPLTSDSHHVMRRTDDGKWIVLLDNPWGTAAARPSGSRDAGTGHTPEQMILDMNKAFQDRNLDALLNLYMPDAVFSPAPGVLVRGPEAVRGANQAFLGAGDQMINGDVAVLESGPFALISGGWHLDTTGPDGKAVIVAAGDSVSLLYRSETDGRWRFFLDNPWGSGFAQQPTGTGRPTAPVPPVVPAP